jgi:seryl-tRNA synthetase
MRSVIGMLDIHYVRENFDLVLDKLKTRNFDVEQLSRFRNLDSERRLRVQQRDELNARGNQLSRDVGNLMREGRKHEAEDLKAESRSVAEDARGLDAQVDGLDKELQEMLTQVPNLPHDSVPAGRTSAPTSKSVAGALHAILNAKASFRKITSISE